MKKERLLLISIGFLSGILFTLIFISFAKFSENKPLMDVLGIQTSDFQPDDQFNLDEDSILNLDYESGDEINDAQLTP